jgi:hypothetical protein
MRVKRNFAIRLALASFLPCSSLSAQSLSPSVAVGSSIHDVSPTSSIGAVVFAPRVDLGLSGAALRLDTRLSWPAEGRPSIELDGTAALLETLIGAFRFTGQLEGQAARFATGDRHAVGLTRAGLEYGAGALGMFLSGAAGAASSNGSGGSLFRVTGGVRSASAARRVGFAVSTTQYSMPHALPDRDTLFPVDTMSAGYASSTTRRASRYTQVELSLNWRGRRWQVNLETGGRLPGDAGPTETWVRARGEARVGSGVSVLASAGWSPSMPELSLAARPEASIALRIAPGAIAGSSSPGDARGKTTATRTHVRDLGAGRRRLRIPAANATRVEVMADFSDWRAIALRPDGEGYWAVDLDLPPGHYRLNVRFDGGPWIVPPGLVQVLDEFGGRVGELLIE